MRPPTPPDWVTDAIFYQIFPDRFARSTTVPKPTQLESWDAAPTSHGFKGGDLIGVVERLDYLQDLGVNAIYFNPVFTSAANHRYHTYDYLRVDPILGGDQALRRLLDEAHRRGMRIILDGVFNHASRGFFQFTHLLENGASSPYLDWFIVHGWPLHAYEGHRPANYAAWWNLRELPKLNTRTPAVREFLWHVARYWIEQGIDGWRLDVPNEIDDDEFWREFRRQVKDANAEAYILGEIWHDASRWLRGDQFDAVMNYPLARACLGFFAQRTLNQELLHNTGYGHVPLLTAASFADTIDAMLCMHPFAVTQAQFNLLGSHDTPRFLSLARGDESAWRLALLFLMTYPGAPCIYYGDEIGLTGGRDPDCRRAFPWPNGASGQPHPWNLALLEHTRQAVALRRAHPALRRGTFIHLYALGDVYAFARQLGDESLVVILNASLHSARIDVPMAPLAVEGAVMEAVWGAGSAQVVGGLLRDVHVPGRSGLVLRPR
jgi:neopullulanase